MKPSETRAEIERLQRLVNRKQATINRLTDSRNKWRDLAQLRWWLLYGQDKAVALEQLG